MHKITRISLGFNKTCFLEPIDYSTISKRLRHNIDPSRPKMPTWKRKKMLAFAQPTFPVEYPTTENLWEICSRQNEVDRKSKNTPNAYEQIYVNEMRNLIENSKMVAIYHANALDTRSKRKVILLSCYWLGKSLENIYITRD